MKAGKSFSWLWIVTIVSVCTFAGQAAEVSNSDKTVYVSDILAQTLLGSQQDWGNLGIDTAAYLDQSPLKLQIGEQVYSKGLGHHASGDLFLNLEGGYERFLATLGVQWQGGRKGTVIFEIYVDDKQVYAGSAMSDSSKPESIDISVKGANMLRLVAKDAGDGWGCDMANWAEARLVKVPGHKPMPLSANNFDAGHFGRVVTFNPDQQGGVSSSRYETFKEDELFLEADVPADENGNYQVHRRQDSRGCIGLQWVLAKKIKSLELQRVSGTPMPLAEQIKVQHWQGESYWQGSWHDITSPVKVEGDLAVVQCAPTINTTRIRWILPSVDAPAVFARPRAVTMAIKQKAKFRLDAVKSRKGKALVEIHNGYFINGRKKTSTLQWNMSRTKEVAVEYNMLGKTMGCQTVLSFWIDNTSGYGPEKHAIGIGVEDVIADEYSYISNYGLCVLKADYKRNADQIGAELAKGFDVLTEVRNRPDQTFEQALTARVIKESLAPIMISLSCDNRKFVVHRDGEVFFTAEPEQGGVTLIGDTVAKSLYPLELRFAVNNRKANGLKRKLHGGWTPIPEITANYEGIDYLQRTFVAPYGPVDEQAHAYINQRPLCVTQMKLENTTDQKQQVSMTVTLKEKDVAQANVTVTEKKGYFEFNGRKFAVCDISSANGLILKNQDGQLIIEGELAAGQKAECMVSVINHLKEETLAGIDSLNTRQGDQLLKTTMDYWQGIMSDAIQIELPDKKLENVIYASMVHCLLASRNEELGDRFVAWGASSDYAYMEGEANPIIKGLDMLGHHEYAGRALDYAMHHFTPDGVIRLPGFAYTPLVGTAWHLWGVGNHYELTEDKDWLRKAAPKLAWSSRWVVRQAEKTKRLSPTMEKLPEYGLVPPGVTADWGLYCYRYMMMALYYAGLRDASSALSEIDYPDAGQLEQSAKELGENILRAYQWTQSRTPAWPQPNGTMSQAYPTSLLNHGTAAGVHGGADMNRALAYDVELGANHLGVMGVIDPMSQEIGTMLEHLENVHFVTGHGWVSAGRTDYTKELNQTEWFNRGGFGKIQPYYGRFTHLYALRDDVKPFLRSYFNSLVYLLDLEALSIWEHALNQGNPAAYTAWAYNKTHETGYFLQQSRMMLVQERGDELWLGAFAPSEWMRDGKRVSVKQAPSAFGEVGYEMVSHVSKGYIEALIDPPARSKPQKLVVRFRHPDETPIRSVKVNGRTYKDFDAEKGCVYIVPGKKSIRVRANFGK